MAAVVGAGVNSWSPAGGNRGGARARPSSMPRLVSNLIAAALVLTGCGSVSDTTVEGTAEPVAEPSSTVPSAVPADLDERYRRTTDLAGRWLDEHDAPVADGLVRDDGVRLTLQVSFGPDHCDWDKIVLLDLAWPLGSEVTTFSEDTSRQYARDLDGVFADRSRTAYAADVEVPEDAVDTGYHRQGNRLLVGPTSAEDAVFVERPDGTVERWPRVVPSPICF